MLDIVEELFCRLYDNSSDHTYGMILFNKNIQVLIPLAAYAPADFINRVEAIRSTVNSTDPLCCSCCTPLGEAFDLAAKEFKANGKANGPDGLQMYISLSPHMSPH